MNKSTKHIYWAWAIKNSVALICWTVLAIGFNHWWIALFSVLFQSGLESNHHHCRVCDFCGSFSPEGKNHDDVERLRLAAGWERRKRNGEWVDICPTCQKAEKEGYAILENLIRKG